MSASALMVSAILLLVAALKLGHVQSRLMKAEEKLRNAEAVIHHLSSYLSERGHGVVIGDLGLEAYTLITGIHEDGQLSSELCDDCSVNYRHWLARRSREAAANE